MHELAITTEVIAAASERAAGARVRRLVLEVGRLTAVLPDAIRFCFDACAEGTPVEGATLEILETPGEAVCRSCAGVVLLDRPFGTCACGSTDLEWRRGEELILRSIEVA
jgi:hydrogenase nickel incorporation protein HypA/HybF